MHWRLTFSAQPSVASNLVFGRLPEPFGLKRLSGLHRKGPVRIQPGAHVRILPRVGAEKLERVPLDRDQPRGRQEPAGVPSGKGGVVRRLRAEVGEKGRDAVDPHSARVLLSAAVLAADPET